MEENTTILSAAEAAEFGEFKRTKRETEISFTLRKLIIDASRRESDKFVLKRACESAERLNAAGLLVSPVNVVGARKQIVSTPVYCTVGGMGESLISVKKIEAKKAIRQGAKQIKLMLCYSALTGGNFAYLKREIKRIRRVVKKRTLIVSLEDHSLGEDAIVLGVKAACAAKADGVCVRGEASLVVRAIEAGSGRIFVEVADVENASQLRLLMKAGAEHAYTVCGEKIAEDLFRSLTDTSL